MQSENQERSRESGASRREAGFTLIEILVVVTIIGLLMTFVGSRLLTQADGAKRGIAQGQLQKIEQSLELYKLQNGRYPTSSQGLEALVRAPTSEPIPRSYPPGGYLKEQDLLDPWGARFKYESPGRNNTFAFDLSSPGPDGTEGGAGTSDDIVNWDVAAAAN